MGKTRDLVKKIRDTKGTFHEKMGSIKDRNGMDLTEAEDIKNLSKFESSFCLEPRNGFPFHTEQSQSHFRCPQGSV